MASSLIICNWKMYFHHSQAVAWFKMHQEELSTLMSSSLHHMVICPSYDAIAPIANIQSLHSPKGLVGKNGFNKISIGAQDCSAYNEGPYTSQVSAQSLKEIGCSYVIIGHSETRKNQKDTTETSVLKTIQAYEHNLTPIVCIGETRDKYTAGSTLNVLEEQVRPLLELYKKYTKNLVIAYEPVWSIGTNQIPDNEHLERVYDYILRKCARLEIQRIPLLLYGGSVDEEVISRLKAVPEIQGFLIGKASTDFQKLKKIVKLV